MKKTNGFNRFEGINFLMNCVPKVSKEPAVRAAFKGCKVLHANNSMNSLAVLINASGEIVAISPGAQEILSGAKHEYSVLERLEELGFYSIEFERF